VFVKQLPLRGHETGGESAMSKSHLSIAQRVVDSVWKAVRLLEDRPEPPPKVKLDGRRGYGDEDIPSPDRTPDRK
jgi:hypothetical protein